MDLEIDIKIYLKFTLENGFKILELKDFGMAKSCRIKYPILDLVVFFDRFEYDAIIEYGKERYNVIHIANFLNDKKLKYKFFDFGFETKEIDAKRFLTQLDEIMKIEFDDILNFLFNLNIQKQNEFDKYCGKTNLNTTGF